MQTGVWLCRPITNLAAALDATAVDSARTSAGSQLAPQADAVVSSSEESDSGAGLWATQLLAWDVAGSRAGTLQPPTRATIAALKALHDAAASAKQASSTATGVASGDAAASFQAWCQRLNSMAAAMTDAAPYYYSSDGSSTPCPATQLETATRVLRAVTASDSDQVHGVARGSLYWLVHMLSPNATATPSPGETSGDNRVLANAAEQPYSSKTAQRYDNLHACGAYVHT